MNEGSVGTSEEATKTANAGQVNAGQGTNPVTPAVNPNSASELNTAEEGVEQEKPQADLSTLQSGVMDFIKNMNEQKKQAKEQEVNDVEANSNNKEIEEEEEEEPQHNNKEKDKEEEKEDPRFNNVSSSCLLYTSPSPRDS